MPFSNLKPASRPDAKERASQRLAALRTNHDLCDATLRAQNETFPIHLAIVAEISPVFKKALCGDFKEGQDKSMTLPDTSPEVLNVILDYAYGVFTVAQLMDFSFCLEVWKFSHQYCVESLLQEASLFALTHVSSQNLVQLVQHSILYGTEADHARALNTLAYHFEEVSHSENFPELTAGQMRDTLSNMLLVGGEDEILAAVLKWQRLNPGAAKEDIEGLYGLVRLERLKDLSHVEALCTSDTCPASLAAVSARLCFQGLQANIGLGRIGHLIDKMKPDSARFFVRGQDSLRGHKTYFSHGNFALSAHVSADGKLCVAVDHLLQRPSLKRTLRMEVTDALFAVYIVETSTMKEAVSQEETITRLASFDEDGFKTEIILPRSPVMDLRKRSFWVFLTCALTNQVKARCGYCGSSVEEVPSDEHCYCIAPDTVNGGGDVLNVVQYDDEIDGYYDDD